MIDRAWREGGEKTCYYSHLGKCLFSSPILSRGKKGRSRSFGGEKRKINISQINRSFFLKEKRGRKEK